LVVYRVLADLARNGAPAKLIVKMLIELTTTQKFRHPPYLSANIA
jgi:hypothetical protein